MLFPTLALLALTLPVLADWNVDHSPFTPTTGQLSNKTTADVSSEVYNELRNARGNVARLNMLLAQNNTDLFKFNFNPTLATSTASRGAGGLAVLADANTMPALMDRGVAMAMGFLEPCG